MEKDFESLTGVLEVVSGYTDGKAGLVPTYKEVSAGNTGFTEAVRVEYAPHLVRYEELVEFFWRKIDPTVKNQQFCDFGSQYRTGIYWQNKDEQAIAEKSKERLIQSKRFSEVHTEIKPASRFYVAEEYHQDYYKKNPLRYAYYRKTCGRDAKLKSLWQN
jgi:peptide-methionine (S)-S-oxide reductase